MSINVVRQLRRIPLFGELSEDELSAVAGLVKRDRFQARSVVCQQGEPGMTAYIVESGGLIALHVDPEGIERAVKSLGPGDYFGETSLLLGEPRDATILVGAEEADLLSLNKADFDKLLQERPEILDALRMRPDVARKRLARHFRWQEPGEYVVVQVRKHSMILVRNLILPILLVLVALGVCWVLRSTLVFLIGWAALSLTPLSLFILYLVADHLNDNYVVTNRRVVHEERLPLIREARTEARLGTIQDVQELREGWAAHLFDFGDLIIETAGERGHVIFRQIPQPSETRDEIFQEIARAQAGARAEERAAIRALLGEQFESQPATDVPPAAAPAQTRKQRLQLPEPRWLRAALRAITSILPPLRSEHGDTITWRKHWVKLIRPTAIPTLGILITTAAAIAMIYLDIIEWPTVLIGYGVTAIVFIPWWAWQFADWQNDFYQVTTSRIIDVERLPLYLREERREASLGRIQNISFEIPGITGKLLNYGSVTIETAGVGPFTFDHVKDPRNVQAEIFARVSAFEQHQRREAAEQRRAELLDWFAVYDQLRTSPPPAAEPTASDQEELSTDATA